MDHVRIAHGSHMDRTWIAHGSRMDRAWIVWIMCAVWIGLCCIDSIVAWIVLVDCVWTMRDVDYVYIVHESCLDLIRVDCRSAVDCY